MTYKVKFEAKNDLLRVGV